MSPISFSGDQHHHTTPSDIHGQTMKIEERNIHSAGVLTIFHFKDWPVTQDKFYRYLLCFH